MKKKYSESGFRVDEENDSDGDDDNKEERALVNLRTPLTVTAPQRFIKLTATSFPSFQYTELRSAVVLMEW